ncbi:hypothetical protein E2C01_044016 [Portunus trituberculatus]|uniref:Uncharacterized protein n=1 Tax=Portunus trituberculatus TaxID=210409 RepID=A0A5B7FYT6_PORTR|nr:hypothetical protein [Portunus trituberculatus]
MPLEARLLYCFISVKESQLCKPSYVTLSERNLESESTFNGNNLTAAEYALFLYRKYFTTSNNFHLTVPVQDTQRHSIQTMKTHFKMKKIEREQGWYLPYHHQQCLAKSLRHCKTDGHCSRSLSGTAQQT